MNIRNGYNQLVSEADPEFPREGDCQLQKWGRHPIRSTLVIFPKNCMKMKKVWTRGRPWCSLGSAKGFRKCMEDSSKFNWLLPILTYFSCRPVCDEVLGGTNEDVGLNSLPMWLITSESIVLIHEADKHLPLHQNLQCVCACVWAAAGLTTASLNHPQ